MSDEPKFNWEEIEQALVAVAYEHYPIEELERFLSLVKAELIV